MPADVPDPTAGDGGWHDDVALLFGKSGSTWSVNRPLALHLQGVLFRSGIPVDTRLRDAVFAAALVHADSLPVRHTAAAIEAAREAAALREGVRGMFWLADASDERTAIPSGPDLAIVIAGDQLLALHELMQRQRWAWLRYGRSKKAGFTAKSTTARSNGLKIKPAMIERLIADLDIFLNDQEALEEFVLTLDSNLVHDRFRGGGRISRALSQRLAAIAASLNSLPRLYPPHLTAAQLAQGRLVARLGDNFHPEEDNDGLFSRGRLVTFDPEPAIDALLAQRRTVLLGDPGAGKSTLARAIVIHAIGANASPAVFVPAAPLARALIGDSEPWVTVLARQALTLPLTPVSEKLVVELAALLDRDPGALIILDGLDEVFDEAHRAVLGVLLRTLDGYPGHVLLTSRLTGYQRSDKWTEYLAVTEPADFWRLMQSWHGEDFEGAKQRFERAADKDFRLRSLTEHPVLAGIIAALSEDSRPDLQGSQAALYRQAVRLLCERDWKAPHHPMRSYVEVQVLLREYQSAAYLMMGRTVTTSYQSLADAGIDAELLRGGDLLTAYGADTAMVRGEQPWIWLHRSFGDYLAGSGLLSLWRRDPVAATPRLEAAVQGVEVWLAALDFLIEEATESEREDIAEVWEALAKRGDPGEMIVVGAGAALRDHPLQAARFAWPPEPNSQDAYDAHFGLREYLSDDTKTLRQRADQAQTALAGILDDRRVAKPLLVRGLEHDPASVAHFWKAFNSRSFPFNVPVAIAMGSAFPTTVPDDADEDRQLAAWWCRPRTYLDGEPQRLPLLPGDLLNRTFAGDFGPWAAFNVARRLPRTLPSDAVSDFARAGALFAGFPRHWSREPTGEMESEEVAEVLRSFAASDAHEPTLLVEVLRALQAIPLEPEDSVLEALVVFSNRLGGPGRRSPASLDVVLDYDAVSDYLRGVLSPLLHSLNRLRLVQIAHGLQVGGTPIHPGAVHVADELTLRDPDTREAMIGIFEWLASMDPAFLTDYKSRLQVERSEEFLRAVFDRLGEKLLLNPKFYNAFVEALSANGLLPKWRERLIEFESL